MAQQKHDLYKVKKKGRQIGASLLRYFMLIVIGYIVLYPLFYMISTSLRTRASFLDVSYQWFPKSVTLEHFKTAFDALAFPTSLLRTLTLQMVSALIEVFVCAFVAYGFARFQFKGKRIATVFLILSLLVPLQMYSLPLSVNYRQLDVLGILGLFDRLTGVDLRFINIFNTNWTYYLPSIFGVGIRSGMMIYIYQQFFIGLPRELEDAAYVDGAGPIRTYFRIALPSSSVVLVTVTVLSVIWHWNEYHLAVLCFLDDYKPLSVAIGNFSLKLQQIGIWKGSSPIFPAVTFAACLLFIAIPLVFYMIMQRKFVKSIDRVGITG